MRFFINFDSKHFIVNEKIAKGIAIASLALTTAAKWVNRNSLEYLENGSLIEQNPLIFSKLKDFNDAQLKLSSRDVVWTEFHNDFEPLEFRHSVMQHIQSLIDRLENAMTLHDFNN